MLLDVPAVDITRLCGCCDESCFSPSQARLTLMTTEPGSPVHKIACASCRSFVIVAPPNSSMSRWRPFLRGIGADGQAPLEQLCISWIITVSWLLTTTQENSIGKVFASSNDKDHTGKSRFFHVLVVSQAATTLLTSRDCHFLQSHISKARSVVSVSYSSISTIR